MMTILPILVITLAISCVTTATTTTGSCQTGTITYYDYNSQAACSFGAVNGPTLAYSITAAPNEYLFNGSSACGECYLLTGTRGSTIIMVADECPAQGNSVCASQKNHFDLGSSDIFAKIEDPSKGVASISSVKVACPLTGNIGILTKDGVSAYWMAIMVFNHVVGVARVEIQPTSTSSYYDMQRQTYNYWIYNKQQLTAPFNLRITSEFGNSITMSVGDFTASKVWTSTSQFPVPSGRGGTCSNSNNNNNTASEGVSPVTTGNSAGNTGATTKPSNTTAGADFLKSSTAGKTSSLPFSVLFAFVVLAVVFVL